MSFTEMRRRKDKRSERDGLGLGGGSVEDRIAHNVAVSNVAPTSLTCFPRGGGSPPLESGRLVIALPIEYGRSDYMYYSQAGYQMAMQLPPLSRGTPLKIIYLFIYWLRHTTFGISVP